MPEAKRPDVEEIQLASRKPGLLSSGKARALCEYILRLEAALREYADGGNWHPGVRGTPRYWFPPDAKAVGANDGTELAKRALGMSMDREQAEEVNDFGKAQAEENRYRGVPYQRMVVEIPAGSKPVTQADSLALVLDENSGQTPEDRVYAFYYDVLGWCGCGMPEEALEFMRDVLRAIRSRRDEGDADGEEERHGGSAEIAKLLNQPGEHIEDPIGMSYLYMLDALGLIEHVTRIDCCWLSGDGEAVLGLLESVDIQKAMGA